MSFPVYCCCRLSVLDNLAIAPADVSGHLNVTVESLGWNLGAKLDCSSVDWQLKSRTPDCVGTTTTVQSTTPEYGKTAITSIQRCVV